MFDFMFMTILFTSRCVNDLRIVELRSSGKDVLENLLRVLGESKSVECAADESTQHEINIKINLVL